MSFPNMSDMAAALPTTSQWTRTPTPVGPQPQPTNLEEFVEAYTRWQHTYAISPAMAGPPPGMPMMPTIQHPSPRSTAQFAIPRSTPTPSSGSSSPSRYTPTPPTVRIPTSPLRRQRTTLIQPTRPLTTPAPVSAITQQVPIPSPNRKIGKSIAAKPEMFDGSKDKFLQWWRTMVFYLMGFETEPSDVQQIMIVLSYMRGDNAAGRFTDLYAQEQRLGHQSFKKFAESLEETFLPKEMKREAERKLMVLKQGQKDTVSDFFVRMKHLTIEAGYDTTAQARLLIRITRDGVHNEIVEYVERSNPNLFETESLAKWEKALTRAEAILTEIADRKRRGGNQNFTRNWFGNRQTDKTTTASTSNTTQSAPKAPEIHPNQVGTFGAQGGVPMDISKARAEGKCFRCRDPWPCTKHFKPRARQIRSFQYRGVNIEYTTAEELEAAITKAEKDFPKGQ